MRDPVLGTFKSSNAEAAGDARWWNAAEPLWVTAERAGLRTARCSGPVRIPPILCQLDEGWDAIPRADFAQRPAHARGSHGYDPALPSMRGLFIASGPAFRRNVRLPVVDNIDVYPLLAHLVGVPPPASDGTLEPVVPALSPEGR